MPVFQGKNSNPFPKLIFQMAKVVFPIHKFDESSKPLVVRDGFLLMIGRPECCRQLNF